jgi:hypothetical protein
MLNYTAPDRRRVDGSKKLVPILGLRVQKLTSVFPPTADEAVTASPLRLVRCPDSGLLQLEHAYDFGEMYGDNYGYRSDLNRSMVRHLTQKVRKLERLVEPETGDPVLDIGSNDATLLKAYSGFGLQRIGIDRTGAKSREHCPDDVWNFEQSYMPTMLRMTSYDTVCMSTWTTTRSAWWTKSSMRLACACSTSR